MTAAYQDPELREVLSEANPEHELRFLDHYDHAILGVLRDEDGYPRVAYSWRRIHNALLGEGMSGSDAENTVGRWFSSNGHSRPVLVDDTAEELTTRKSRRGRTTRD